MSQNNFKIFKNLKIFVDTKNVKNPHIAIFLVLLRSNFFSTFLVGT